MVTLHAAAEQDILFVAERLREGDRRELETASGLDPVSAVLRGAALSEVLYTAHVHGEPSVVFGVAPGGVVWMVCTDAISKARREVFRVSRQVAEAFLQVYPRLWNQADCRNTLHLRWLRLLGATFDDIVEVNGYPFQRFHLEKE